MIRARVASRVIKVAFTVYAHRYGNNYFTFRGALHKARLFHGFHIAGTLFKPTPRYHSYDPQRAAVKVSPFDDTSRRLCLP